MFRLCLPNRLGYPFLCSKKETREKKKYQRVISDMACIPKSCKLLAVIFWSISLYLLETRRPLLRRFGGKLHGSNQVRDIYVR